LSPLLKFAIESLEHALEQYVLGTDKSRRFSVLHCDQAIELVLKEKIRFMGDSIFSKNGKTIDYYDSITKLIDNRGVKIPERPDLELIHESRNLIQHKGATISESEAEYYIQTGFNFMKRFLIDELRISIDDIMEKRYHNIFVPEYKNQLQKLFKENYKVFENLSSPIVVINSYRQLELLLSELSTKFNLKQNNSPRQQMRELLRLGKISEIDFKKFEMVSQLRNEILHTEKIPEIDDIVESVKMISKLTEVLNKLN
jgi:uncharacterized protein YutE (UPF0331/DUF86 family)